MRTIYLHGSLKEFSKDPILLDADTPAMVAQGLMCRFDNAEEAPFHKALNKGTFEFVIINKDTGNKTYVTDEVQQQNEISARSQIDSDEIHITPVIAGSGRFGQIILGVVLIIAGALGLPGGIGAGIALIAGGIVQLLTPIPNFSAIDAERPDSRASYLFNGPVNQSEEGAVIPLVYGRVPWAGTLLISAGFDVEQLPFHVNQYPHYPDGAELDYERP